ncbi:MAG: DUF2953 domain-containing protein [Ruminococcaceae bacterium]|nr:DUF2953 domain-containing protein [Oscillospiraceae bacterium]
MKALLIILGMLLLLGFLPVGAYVRYDRLGPLCELILGPVRLRLLPKKKKDKKPKEKAKKPKEKKERPKQPIGGLIRDFYPFVKLGFELLGCFFRKLRVNVLTLHVGFGGAGDPAAAAINYGRAWAAIGALMPQLRRFLRIKKENVSASCDFTSGEMTIFAELKATFFLGDLVAMAIRYGLRALKLLLAMKKRKSQEKSSDKAVQSYEPSSS